MYRVIILFISFYLTACASHVTLIENIESLPVTASGISTEYMDKEGVGLDFWSNIGGRAVRGLTRNTRFPSDSDKSELVFEIDFVNTKGDKYAQRIRAYFQVPESGDYQFWVSADESAELWLSTNELPENRRLIALVNKPSGYKVWDKYRSQKSKLIHLDGNQRYFMEILHKENNGDDYLTVSWSGVDDILRTLSSENLSFFQTEDFSKEDFQQAYHLGYQAGSHLVPYAEGLSSLDSDQDGLPDFYENLIGTDSTDGYDALTDLDNDLLTNLDEYYLLTNPINEDTDGDNLTDGYEVMYGLNATNSKDALLDLDGDGISNLSEYLANTLPDDPNDFPVPIPAPTPEPQKSLVSISWNTPDSREDESDLDFEDIASYKIYSGIVESDLSILTEVTQPEVSSFEVGELEPGAYYFAMSTVTKDGLESALSPVLLMEVN